MNCFILRFINFGFKGNPKNLDIHRQQTKLSQVGAWPYRRLVAEPVEAKLLN